MKWIALPLLCLGLWSCGNSETKGVEDPEGLEFTFAPDTTASIPIDRLEKRREQRNASGDTVATDPERLRKSLAFDIQGYGLEINKAETFQTKRFTFSEATKVFYNPKGDYVELIAGDYVANPEFFEVALQRYNLAQGVELDGLTDRKLPIEWKGEGDCFAWESFSGPRNLAQANIVVDYRYFISISCTGRQSFVPRKELFTWIDLASLEGK